MNTLYQYNDIEYNPQNEDLQRSESWHKDRNGRFTGSKIKDLMKCTAKTRSIGWGKYEKITDFSDTAKKYIYEKAMERKTGLLLKRSIGKNGEYGEKAEVLIKKILLKKYPDFVEIKEHGFIEFIEGVAGASPDGSIESKLLALEIKAAMLWNGFFERKEKYFDESHIDFWQVQTEMMALDLPACLYVIGYPSEDLNDIIIKDTEEITVEASPIHQDAIINRCLIADNAINLYLGGLNFFEAMHESISKFEI